MLVESTIAIAMIGVLFRVRQAQVRRRFLRWHGHQVRHENEAVANAWRRSHPRETRLVVERRLRLDGFLAPTITIKQTFRRDRP